MTSNSLLDVAKSSQNDNNEEQSKVVVVVVPLPAQGHLNQLLHFSHLVSSYDIPIHFVGSSTHNHQAKARLHGHNHHNHNVKIHFHDMQLPPLDPTPPPNTDLSIPFPTHIQHLLEASTLHLREPVYHLMQQLSLKFSRVIVIHDILTSSVVQDVKLISNAEAYTFIPLSTFTFLYDCSTAMPQKFRPFHTKNNIINPGPKYDLFEECMPKELWDFTINQVKLLGFESGWLYNSSRVIEGGFINMLESLKTNMNHFAIGPLHPIVHDTGFESKHQCLEWLNKQEKGSVIYVSFGSITSLKDDQINELANGLDRCGKKFIWVLRNADPNDVVKQDDNKKLEPQLPQGYEEKVENKGIVIRDWAPQLDILAHESIGGFMSHCGWNSCLESLSMGVPIAAWPMHSDQPRNAYLVCDVLRVGVVVRDWAHRNELVTSNSIENVVKRLMLSNEGKEMKERATKLGKAIRESVGQGGVSCFERDAFIAHVIR